SPSCIIRRLVALVMTPKEVPPKVSFGVAQFGVFVMLNISQRNCARHRSPTRKFLVSKESKLIVGGLSTLVSVLDALPKVYCGGLANAAGFSQSRPRTPTAGDPFVEAYNGWPVTRFGRRVVPSELSPRRFVGPFKTRTPNGEPDCSVP